MRSLGRSPSSRWPLRRSPSPRVAVHSSWVPTSWTTPHSTSPMVGPEAPAPEREKKPIPRFALSEPSIGSITTCTAPSPSLPISSETNVTSSTPSKRASTARSAAWSIAVVSSPPMPAPTTGSRSARVGSSASTCRTSSTAPRQSASQSIKRMEEQTRCQLGIEVRALLRHRLAAFGDRAHLLDRRRSQQECRLRASGVDGTDRLFDPRRVAHAFRPEALDESGVESGFVSLEHARLSVAIERDGGPVTWQLVELLQRVADSGDRIDAVDVSEPLDDPVGGGDRQPFLPRRSATAC